MNLSLLQQLVADQYINVQKHPTADLWIYNYAAKTQYEQLWNEVTLACRGFILDSQGRVVARPFPKFFNLSEHDPSELPDEPFEVFEKMDGSLGILYWVDDQPYIATRGSFSSDQAKHATALLHERYTGTFSQLRRDVTYLFEIIYPDNRIVVDYGFTDELYLLGIIDNSTGQELPNDPGLGFPLPRQHEGLTDWRHLHHQPDSGNREGFVLRFQNGLRVKVKFEEYVRLHRLITGVSNVTVWEHLAAGRSLDELLERVPDEFYNWVQQVVAELQSQFSAIEFACQAAFKVLETRKDTALYFLTQPHPQVLFAMLDGKDYAGAIWKLVKPGWRKAWRVEG
ncbi:MAG: T4 RnlA family RNA ligase [Phycisphaerae bacterium]|nr:T4 RnlA family RNA ligase [Saprospiraceae bacterium]